MRFGSEVLGFDRRRQDRHWPRRRGNELALHQRSLGVTADAGRGAHFRQVSAVGHELLGHGHDETKQTKRGKGGDRQEKLVINSNAKVPRILVETLAWVD